MEYKRKFLGTIGLDIDGTITDHRRGISDEVALFLTSLYKCGWCIIFITGRDFVYAMDALSKLNFPYYLAVQNGADLIQMPEKKHLKSIYLDSKILQELEGLFEPLADDFLVYSGYERGDFCYYRPHKYSDKMIPYLQAMQKRSAMPWKAVRHFNECPQETFPLIKAVGSESTFLELESKLSHRALVQYVIIKDPVSKEYDYLLITDKKASKRHALEYFMETFDLPRPLIVGGDDHNDRASLECADIKVVMENAPASLKSMADIIAPLSINNGIIQGLNEALIRV